MVGVRVPNANDLEVAAAGCLFRSDHGRGIKLVAVSGSFDIEVTRLLDIIDFDDAVVVPAYQQATGLVRIAFLHHGLEPAEWRFVNVQAGSQFRYRGSFGQPIFADLGILGYR